MPLGETIAGWMAWDSMRTIDYPLARDDVDGGRIGVTGNSGEWRNQQETPGSGTTPRGRSTQTSF